MGKYAKFITAAVGVVLAGLATFFGIGDGTQIFGFTGTEITNLVIGILTAAGVYQVENKTD